jgi:uncharacterized membrane protein HdeD (DUF308 family)/alpha-beta hydrolase superfamily lysophospholipase
MTLTRITRPISRLRDRMPVWVGIGLDTVAVVLGAVLVIRPTTALDVLALLLGGGMVLTGILQFAGDPGTDDAATGDPGTDDDATGDDATGGDPGAGNPGAGTAGDTGAVGARLARWRFALAVVWIVVGVIVLVWPALTVRAAAVLVGGVLLLAGALGVIGAFRPGRTWDERLSDFAFGSSGLIFGVVAFAWPDITLLVVAVVFGAWLIMQGLSRLWTVLRSRRDRRRGIPDRPSRRRRWGRAVIAIGAVALAVTTATVIAPLDTRTAVVDDFYAAPRDTPDEPGRLVRAEPFTRDIPASAQAWRILYTTTGTDGGVRVASALVVVPLRTDETGDRPWPVIDWNHGTTGYAQHCAPSLQERPLWSGAMYVTRRVIAEGWAMVATDYIGLGTEGPHPYLIGEPSAHASLDAVRAARELPEAELSLSTVIWGHSQGGGAALWAGSMARSYAPELWVKGIAALAPASDPLALVDRVSNVTAGSIFASFAFASFSEIYPDVSYREYIRPGAETILRSMSERCLSDPGTIVSVVAALSMGADLDVFAKDPTTGALGRHLAESTTPLRMDAPLLIAQGGDDSVVLPRTQTDVVERMCSAGQLVDYRVYEGFQHAAVVEGYSPLIPELLEWTRARFAGDPVPITSCARTDIPAS